jgi:hypothetical protein
MSCGNSSLQSLSPHSGTFDLKMKLRRKQILTISGLILIAIAIFSWIQYRKIEKVHKVAILSTSDSFSDLHQDFNYIAWAVLDSDLVVRGTIVEPDSIIQASSDQNEVAYPQGWGVARVRINKCFSGVCGASEILIVPAGWWPTPVVGNSFIKPFAKDEEYLFFLKRDDKLSRWCRTTVFDHSGQHPIPLPKSGSNKENSTNGVPPSQI